MALRTRVCSPGMPGPVETRASLQLGKRGIGPVDIYALLWDPACFVKGRVTNTRGAKYDRKAVLLTGDRFMGPD